MTRAGQGGPRTRPAPTPEQQAEAVRLARRGEPYSVICRETGLSDKQARGACMRAGVDARTRMPKGTNVRWTDTMLARLEALWDRGLSSNDIAEQMSIPLGAVEGKRVLLGLSRDDALATARLARPDGTHRRAAMARLGLDPQDAARFPRRIALVAAAIAMEQSR